MFFVKKHFKKVGLDFFIGQNKIKMLSVASKSFSFKCLIENGSIFKKSRAQLILFHSKGFFFPNQKSVLAKKKKRERKGEGAREAHICSK